MVNQKCHGASMQFLKAIYLGSQYLKVDFFTQEPINTIGLAGMLKGESKAKLSKMY